VRRAVIAATDGGQNTWASVIKGLGRQAAEKICKQNTAIPLELLN